jgi:ubiquinol-cytochrome c reductase cytochrome b subunit
MITRMLDWLDHRAGVRKLVAMTLLEGVPGGANWRYVWGSTLAFVFSIQLITGVMLMTAYSPSASQAWSSVHFIQYKMDFGWLIRGLHHFGSQTMMVLIGLHMLQVVIAGAHLPPREVNWWLGIGLLSVTLGLSLTGYLLPWDQKGYWATDVATNIAGSLPGLGGDVKQQAVGGPDSGNHTLTRFYGLHVAILPGSLILLLVAHIAIFRRHGVTCKENQEGLVNKPENEHAAGSEPFWPRQAFYDMIACMAVFAIMLGLVLYGFAHKVEPPPREDGSEPSLYETIARAGVHGKGAELDAAADRSTSNYPARPEWYFLALFQLLKYFPGDSAIYGTVVIPNGVMIVLILLPFFGIGPLRNFGHFFGILVIFFLLAGAVLLTLKAFDDDSPSGILWGVMKDKSDEKAVEKADGFVHAVHDAEKLAQRACQLAMNGSPVEGGHFLIRNDPFTTGQQLFKIKCAACHSFTAQPSDTGKDGNPKFESMVGKTASDLGNFGSKEWVRGLLKDPTDNHYFGLVKRDEKDQNGKEIKVPGLTRMEGWRIGIDKARKAGTVDAAVQDKQFDKIAEWLEYIGKTPKALRKDDALIKAGQDAFGAKKNRCTSCHAVEMYLKDDKKWEKDTDPSLDAPDLTEYGSADWLRGMIMRPGHKSRYGERNLMPAFRPKDGVGAEIGLQEFRETNEKTPDKMIQELSDVDRELIIRWILRDYRPVYGGAPISK